MNKKQSLPLADKKKPKSEWAVTFIAFLMVSVICAGLYYVPKDFGNLRKTNPELYLTQLEKRDPAQYLVELRYMKPASYDAEAQRLKSRIQQIQNDEVRQLRNRQQIECEDARFFAKVHGQLAVRDAVLTRTVSFPWSGHKAESIGNCVFRVSGKLKYENLYGVLLRARYQVDMKHINGKWSHSRVLLIQY